LKIQLKILDPRLGREFPLPQSATKGSAGIDLRAMIAEKTLLAPGQVLAVPAGISVYIADPGYMACIFPRSGLGSKHGIVLGNLTGIIDSDYQGPIIMPLWNRSTEPFALNPGDRVAQMVFVPVACPEFDVVGEFNTASGRGSSGFGSSGLG
jgi:dUTP pyrophosphatase